MSVSVIPNDQNRTLAADIEVLMAKHTCPVCGFTGLPDPPKDFNICPCCGTEFENDDFDATHEELRAAWVANGSKWWSNYTKTPADFDPIKQVEAL